MKYTIPELLTAMPAKATEKAVIKIADEAVKDEYKNKEKEKPLTTSERLDRIERLLKIK